MSEGAPSAVLEAHEARIDVDGAMAVERLSILTEGDRVVIAGDTGALFAAITGVPRSAAGGRLAPSFGEDIDPPGEADVVAGSLMLAGKSVGERAHVAIMGAASLDPPLPPGWSAEAYVEWGARLAGVPRKEARELAAVALGRVGLTAARRKRASALTLAERRALVLGQAIVAGPEVLVADAPLRALEGPAADLVLRALEAAAEGRRLLVSVTRLDAGSAEGVLARGADYLAVLARGEVALEGLPAELFAGARVYALTVRTNPEPLRSELAARGIQLRGGPARFSASLDPGASARDILAAAHAAGAAVVEMVPLIG